MNVNKSLSKIEKEALDFLKTTKNEYLLGYPGVRLGRLSFGDRVVPFITCEDDFLIPDRKTFSSTRRRTVFRNGGVVYQSGEMSTDNGFHKGRQNHLHSAVKIMANINLMKEVATSFKLEEFVHKVSYLVYDIPSEELYIAKKYELTLSNAARGVGPRYLRGKAPLEHAAEDFYTRLERAGLVYVPRLRINGNVDLGDIIITRDRDGGIKLKANDDPIILPKFQAEINNTDSYNMMILGFMKALRHRK